MTRMPGHLRHPRNLWLGLVARSLQFVDELQRFAPDVRGQYGVHDALDRACSNAFVQYGFEINELFGGQQNLASRQWTGMVAQFESLENRTCVQCLADQFLLLGIEQVRNEFTMITHDRRPKINGVPIPDADITAGDLFKPAYGALCFADRVIEEEGKH